MRPRRVSRIHPRRPRRPRRHIVHRRRPLRLRSRRRSRRRRRPNPSPPRRGAPDPRSTGPERPRRSSRRGRRRCLLGPRTYRPRRVHLSPRCPQTSHRAKTTATAPGHRTRWHRGMHPLIHSSPHRQSLLRQSRRRSPRTLNYPTRTTEHTNRRCRRTRTSTPHSAASPSAGTADHPRVGPKTRRCGR